MYICLLCNNEIYNEEDVVGNSYEGYIHSECLEEYYNDEIVEG